MVPHHPLPSCVPPFLTQHLPSPRHPFEGFAAYAAAAALTLAPTLLLPVGALTAKKKTGVQGVGEEPGAQAEAPVKPASNAVPFARRGPGGGGGSVDGRDTDAATPGSPTSTPPSSFITPSPSPTTHTPSPSPLTSRSSALSGDGVLASSALGADPGAAEAVALGAALAAERHEDDDSTTASISAAATADAANTSLAAQVASVVANPTAAAFFGLATLLGVAAGTIASFLPLYLTDLGASETVLGAAIAVACAAEVPVFFFAGSLVQRVGARRMLDVAVACYVVR